MGGCEAVTFHNVTPAVFNCMKKKLEGYGMKIPSGNSGDIEGHGVKAHFNWDGEKNLTIKVNEKPFYASCGAVSGKLHDFVIDCHGA